jgi:rhodanese-related sulfurtransferase
MIKNKSINIKKESILRFFLIILMATGFILVIAMLLLNFTNMGKNIKNDIIKKISQNNNSVENFILDSEIKRITVDEAYGAYVSDDEYIFLDVRSTEEYNNGHIRGAVLMPVSDISERLSELPRDKPIIVYCNGSSCGRSEQAVIFLMNNGYDKVYNLTGNGIFEWQEKGYPFETGN